MRFLHRLAIVKNAALTRFTLQIPCSSLYKINTSKGNYWALKRHI